MKNGPNILTSLRILAVPAIVVILLVPFRGREITAFVVFVLAAITDAVDGIWARRKNLTSEFGSLLDPTADKLLIASTLICLVELGTIRAWMAALIIGREIAMSGFRAIASSKGIHITASALGKAKMGLEIWTIGGLLLGPRILGPLYIIPRVGLWLVLAVAVVSAAEYYIRFGPRVLAKPSPGSPPAPAPGMPDRRRSAGRADSPSSG